MINAKDINSSFDLLAVVERDTQLHKDSGGWYSGPCPFCGGVDRFVLKHTTSGYCWLCRKCTDAKYKTVIDYIMKRDNLEFPAALHKVGGDFTPMTVKPQPEKAVFIPPNGDWQERAQTTVHEAHDMLLGDPKGQRGRDYLESRGISMGSQYYWRLGFATNVYKHEGRPAITIPHYAIDQSILAVKYRFLDNNDPRFWALGGSKIILYGLFRALGGSTLLIVEGELNCISIRQCLPAGIDVVSTGTQNLNQYSRPALQDLAKLYKRRVAWLDEDIKAREVGELIEASIMLKSPIFDGVKYDANRILQEGKLVDFLNITGIT